MSLSRVNEEFAATFYDTPWLDTTGFGLGNRHAIKPTLRKERIPRNQKMVDRLAETSSKPTMDVEVVLETCWISRSKETMPPRNSTGAFCVKRLFCIGEITPLASP